MFKFLASIGLTIAKEFDDRFGLNHPLSKSTFKHWKASSSAVFLQKKTILTPELPGKVGMIAAKNTFNLHAFALEIDIGIHNKMGASTPRGQVHIYLLRDNPMKTP